MSDICAHTLKHMYTHTEEKVVGTDKPLIVISDW